MKVKQRLYDAMLRRHRRDDDPRAAAITPERLRARDERPRRGARRLRDLQAADRLSATVASERARPGRAAPGAGRRSTPARRAPAGPDPLRGAAAPRRPTRGPTAEELEAAYGDWYRPEAGSRFSLRLGDAILGRTRGLLAGADRRDRPARAGARRRRRRRHAARRPARAAAARRPGWSGAPTAPTSATSRSSDVEAAELGGRRLLALARAPARARRRDPRGRPPAQARRRHRHRRAQQRQPPGARVRRRLAAPRPAPPPRPPLRRRACAAGFERAGFAIERTSFARGGQIVIGWLRRARRHAPGSARPLPVAAPPGRRADAAVAPGAAGRSRSPPRSCFCRSRGRCRGRGRAAPRRDRLR